MTPTSGPFKMITGASVAYGLTDAGGQAERIGLTDLGKRAVAPLEEGDDIVAIREAILKPRVVREFLERYNGSRVPNRSIAQNVLETMGVPGDASERALDMILENAKSADFLETVKGADYVTLDKVPSTPAPLRGRRVRRVRGRHRRSGGSSAAGRPKPAEPDQNDANPARGEQPSLRCAGKNRAVVERIEEYESMATSCRWSRWSAKRSRSRYRTRSWMTCGRATPESCTSAPRWC